MITDCHIHIQPLEMFQPRALELLKKKRPNFDQIVEFCRSPKAFLEYLDKLGVQRAVLINYVAPEVIGFSFAVKKKAVKSAEPNFEPVRRGDLTITVEATGTTEPISNIDVKSEATGRITAFLVMYTAIRARCTPADRCCRSRPRIFQSHRAARFRRVMPRSPSV